jgi:hypothetical protein
MFIANCQQEMELDDKSQVFTAYHYLQLEIKDEYLDGKVNLFCRNVCVFTTAQLVLNSD